MEIFNIEAQKENWWCYFCMFQTLDEKNVKSLIEKYAYFVHQKRRKMYISSRQQVLLKNSNSIDGPE